MCWIKEHTYSLIDNETGEVVQELKPGFKITKYPNYCEIDEDEEVYIYARLSDRVLSKIIKIFKGLKGE